MCRERQKTCRTPPKQRHVRNFFGKVPPKRNVGFLKLNTFQARQLTIGHCRLNRLLIKVEKLTALFVEGASQKQPHTCRCLTETASHMFCDSGAIQLLRFRRLSKYFLEPINYD
jgi:hypothetical protein